MTLRLLFQTAVLTFGLLAHQVAAAAPPACDTAWTQTPAQLLAQLTATAAVADGSQTWECSLKPTTKYVFDFSGAGFKGVRFETPPPTAFSPALTPPSMSVPTTTLDTAVLKPNDSVSFVVEDAPDWKGVRIVLAKSTLTLRKEPPDEWKDFADFLRDASKTSVQFPVPKAALKPPNGIKLEGDPTSLSPGKYVVQAPSGSFTIEVAVAGNQLTVSRVNITRECDKSDFEPAVDSVDRADMELACKDKLCLTPSGEVYGVRSFEKGSVLVVELWAPQSPTLKYSMDVNYKKSRLLVSDTPGPAGAEHKAAQRFFARVTTQTFELTAPGKLHISLGMANTGPDAVVSNGPGRTCKATKAIESSHVFAVSGDYYFMLGIMPTLPGLSGYSHTLHRSDDGVQRLFEQEVQSIDYAMTLSAFPGGVDADHDRWAVGVVLGTSIKDLGRRWYLGVELSSPIYVGLVVGAGAVLVDELDQDFVSGQPLEDTNVPTHLGVRPTWFLGINIEAELFKKAFAGITGS